jgi:hypothetical protein
LHSRRFFPAALSAIAAISNLRRRGARAIAKIKLYGIQQERETRKSGLFRVQVVSLSTRAHKTHSCVPTLGIFTIIVAPPSAQRRRVVRMENIASAHTGRVWRAGRRPVHEESGLPVLFLFTTNPPPPPPRDVCRRWAAGRRRHRPICTGISDIKPVTWKTQENIQRTGGGGG